MKSNHVYSIVYLCPGEPKKIFNLYKDAASYWALDSVEDLKDRARLGWGTAHGEVTLVPKGLSGHALQLDGVSGWIDLGDLGPACAEANCSEDFSISMWMKYYPKESEEDQSFLTFSKYTNTYDKSLISPCHINVFSRSHVMRIKKTNENL